MYQTLQCALNPTLALAALGLAAATPALAHDGHHGGDHNQIEGVRFDVHGTVSPYTVFGVGLRGEGAIVPDGFFGGDVHDELALSLGGDAYFYELNPDWYSGGVYLVPIAALQWNFYVGQHWSIFPEAGLAFHVQPDNNGWNGRNAVYAEPDLALGVRYHFSHRNALMVRGGVPGGLQIGLTF